MNVDTNLIRITVRTDESRARDERLANVFNLSHMAHEVGVAAMQAAMTNEPMENGAIKQLAECLLLAIDAEQPEPTEEVGRLYAALNRFLDGLAG